MAEKFIITTKYLDYANVFLKKLAITFFRRFYIKKHVIDLEASKELFYEPI